MQGTTDWGAWRWIESAGGPLVIVPAGLPWAGCPPNANADPLDPSHDYGRACAVRDYADTMPTGTGECLVLGDESMRTTWVPADQGGWLIRWMYAPDEATARAAFDRRACPEQDWCLWHMATSPCLLFDSA